LGKNIAISIPVFLIMKLLNFEGPYVERENYDIEILVHYQQINWSNKAPGLPV